MKLYKFSYTEHEGLPEEWKTVECTLDDVNLIVGKNASGKSRTLNVLKGLSDLLSVPSELKYTTGSYEVEFKDEASSLVYNLNYKNIEVISEKLTIDEEIVLTRTHDGKGKIKLDETGELIEFQTGVRQVAAASKRDLIQHPFLEKLLEWGEGLIKYEFGTQLGRDVIIIAAPGTNIAEKGPNIKDAKGAVVIFKKGFDEFGQEFVDTIISDMKVIGYDLKDVGITSISGLNMPDNIQGKPLGLFVQEADLPCKIHQNTISAGMFRALSVIIQISYSLLSGEPSCILIDDIGEGLDFSRSSALLNLMLDKVSDSNTQLIMTTNDRFIMNSVPIKNWILLERSGGTVIQHNYRNTKELFDEFEMTGLNNFDLFSSNYILKKSTNGS